jgi:S1-C subfamily serine protease
MRHTFTTAAATVALAALAPSALVSQVSTGVVRQSPVQVQREHEQLIARLSTELANHQTTIATLERRLIALGSSASSADERRAIESRLSDARARAAQTDRELSRHCESARSTRGYLGAEIVTIDTAGSRAFGSKYPIVWSVSPGSPAAQAGIAPHDTLVAVNQRDLRGAPLESFLVPGNELDVTLLRGGARQTMKVTVGPPRPAFGAACITSFAIRVFEQPDSRQRSAVVGTARGGRAIAQGTSPGQAAAGGRFAVRIPDSARASAGVVGGSITAFMFSRDDSPIAGAELVIPTQAGLRNVLGLLPTDTGALVLNVDPNSPAGQSGILSGDLIVRAGGQLVTSIGTLRHLIAESRTRSVQLQILRKPATAGNARQQRRETVSVTLRW